MDAGEPSIESLVAHATAGDAAALDALVRSVQDRVYRLALRMLGNPADAADASQEILVRVVTHLGSFRGEAAFSTWVHKVASNYLLTARASHQPSMSFEALGALIDGGQDGADDPTRPLLAAEVRMTCTEAMLLCLDAGQRLAFVLGEILELSGDEAAWVLDLSPDAYRQRLSRARASITAFMKTRCGVFSKANPCRCSKQVPQAIRMGMLDPARLQLARHPVSEDSPPGALDEVLDVLDAATIYRQQPRFAAPEELARVIRDVISETRG
jgi:RNA polymerase sigma factor (sigma-70 family)